MWQSIKKSFYPVEQRAVQLDFPEQLPISSLHHSDVYSRSFGNTSNLIPSLLQHPSVYLLINQLRALFADQESGSQIRFVSAHIISFDHHLSDPGRLHNSNLYSFKKVQTIKKIFTASFWPRPCLALASTCRLMTSLVTRVIACKTWQPSTASDVMISFCDNQL